MSKLHKSDISMSISISVFEKICSRILVNRVLVVVESVIFANSLISTTIQDSGKRKKWWCDYNLWL